MGIVGAERGVSDGDWDLFVFVNRHRILWYIFIIYFVDATLSRA